MNFESESLGRYQLLAHLTTGGMSEIHLALHTGIYGFEKLVVIKRILPGLARDNTALEMFFDEARIAVELNHPNIVQIYELGEDKGEYYIAMEFMEGESLGYLVNEVISSGRYLPSDLVANIVHSVAEGLNYAHSYCDATGRPLNIIHRDVSPQNIFLMFTGGIKLLDFGIATARSQIHKTQVGTMKGKIAYMSPEQIAGDPIDNRSDIYSLGIVLWELLARFRLYNRGGDKTIAKQIAYEPVQNIRSFRPDVPKELEAIAMKSLEKNPNDRYRCAGQMRDALWSYLIQSKNVKSVSDIARYLEQVLSERILKKKQLLQNLRQRDFEEEATVLSLFQPEPEDEEFEFDNDVSLLSEPILRSVPGNEPVTVVVENSKSLNRESTCIEEKPLGQTSCDTNVSNRKVPWFMIVIAVVGGLAFYLLLSRQRTDFVGAKTTGVETVSMNKRSTAPLNLRLLSRPSNCRIILDGSILQDRTPIYNLVVEARKRHTIIIDCPNHYREARTIKGHPGQEIILDFRPPRIKNQRF